MKSLLSILGQLLPPRSDDTIESTTPFSALGVIETIHPDALTIRTHLGSTMVKLVSMESSYAGATGRIASLDQFDVGDRVHVSGTASSDFVAAHSICSVLQPSTVLIESIAGVWADTSIGPVNVSGIAPDGTAGSFVAGATYEGLLWTHPATGFQYFMLAPTS